MNGTLEMKTHRKLLSLMVIVLIAVVSILTYSREKQSLLPPSIPNLITHPVYSKYNFDTSSQIINRGTQPFYSPTGLITETIKRDLIVRKALDPLGFSLRMYPFLKGDGGIFY